MVRPPKLADIQERKNDKKNLKPYIEERYRNEAPQYKKGLSEKVKSPGSSPGGSLKAKNPTSKKTKPSSPQTSKLAKTASQQPATTAPKRTSIPQSKSHTNKPSELTSRAKTRKSTVKKSSLEAPADPIQRLLKASAKEEKTVGDRLPADNSKMTSKLSKIGKVVTGAKKIIKKSTLKKSTKTVPKNLSFNLKHESGSVVSLTTHFRMPFLHDETTATAPRKVTTSKKRKTSTLQKKISKAKDDQEDTTKDAKNKRKSKLNNMKLDRILSSDSVPIFSIREIKHNDSFVISARKLQKSSSERRDHKPDCLKLSTRTSIIKGKPTDTLPLKSCLKKTLEGENKIMEYVKKEGNLRLHETFQIV